MAKASNTVAQLYPARVQPDGTIWYRAGGGKMDGWTASPERADPSYRDPGAPEPIPYAASDVQRDRNCEQCLGEHHKSTDQLKFDPRQKLWLCVVCRTESDLAFTDALQAEMESVATGNDAELIPQAVEVLNVLQEGIDQMTEISHNGEAVERQRETQWSRYPLPPAPPRFRPTFNRFKQYMLPHPSTGRETSFARATTVSETMDNRYTLERWIQRQKVNAVMSGIEVEQTLADAEAHGDAPVSDILIEVGKLMTALRAELANGNGTKTNDVVDMLDNMAGGRDSAELGEAVHAWLEAIDIGQVRPADVPEMFVPYVAPYRDLLLRHALIPVPEYVERIVYNDMGEETIVGTLDRIYRVVDTGELVLGDVKTSKASNLEYSWLTYAVQLVIYRLARLMLSTDGTTWENMPEITGKAMYLMHIPSDQPDRSACITLDGEFGWEGLQEAIKVRQLRTRASKEAPFKHAIPTPSPAALRYAAARHAIQDISAPAELAVLWEEYQDVWDEDLTALGRQIAALFTATPISEGALQ